MAISSLSLSLSLFFLQKAGGNHSQRSAPGTVSTGTTGALEQRLRRGVLCYTFLSITHALGISTIRLAIMMIACICDTNLKLTVSVYGSVQSFSSFL